MSTEVAATGPLLRVVRPLDAPQVVRLGVRRRRAQQALRRTVLLTRMARS